MTWVDVCYGFLYRRKEPHPGSKGVCRSPPPTTPATLQLPQLTHTSPPYALLFLALHALSHAVKVPQIAKIVRANSAKGVSLFSHLLELYSYTFTLSYPVSQGNPFRCVRP